MEKTFSPGKSRFGTKLTRHAAIVSKSGKDVRQKIIKASNDRLISASDHHCDPQCKKVKVKIVSPNDKLIVVVELLHGKLTYKVNNKKGKTIILSSNLGLVRADSDFTRNLHFVSSEGKSNDSLSYTNPLGKFSSQRIIGTRASLVYANSQNKKLTVEFFVTDFAISFRYRFLHEDPGLMIDVKSEATTTTIPLRNSDGTAAQSLYRPYAFAFSLLPEVGFPGLHNYLDYQQNDVRNIICSGSANSFSS